MRGHHMTSQCTTWHHTTQEIASHKMKTHQITSHDMTWHLATNHITSPHVTSQPTALLHRSLQPTTSKQVTTSPPWNGWRPVHSNNSVWASQWLVTLCTFYRQILSLTYSFFSLKLPPPACPALLVLQSQYAIVCQFHLGLWCTGVVSVGISDISFSTTLAEQGVCAPGARA